MKNLSIIISTIIIVLGICLALLNSHSVSLNYIIGRASLPLSVLLILVFGLGCLFGLSIQLGNKSKKATRK